MQTTTNNLLQDAKTTDRKLSMHLQASSSAVLALEQTKEQIPIKDYETMHRFATEIVRDSKIFKRQINLFMDNVLKHNLNEYNEDLNDKFLSILDSFKIYNNKWSKSYLTINGILEKVIV